MPGAHDVVGAAVGLARDDRQLGHRGFAIGIEQFRAVLDDAAMFLRDSRQEPGHVLERHERDIERVAEPNEARPFDGRRNVQHARERGGLIGDDADRPSRESRKTHDEIVGVIALHFEEGAVIHDMLEHVVHVVGLRRLIRHDLEQRFFASIRRIVRRTDRRAVEIVAGQE